MFNKLIVQIVFFLCALSLNAGERPFVTVNLEGQFGNQCFQIATTCAYAWENDFEPIFPDLVNKVEYGIPINLRNVFFRCNTDQVPRPIKKVWTGPVASFEHIPIQEDMQLKGGFASYKYFEKYREELLWLFAPSTEDLEMIQTVYEEILNHPCSVGVQLRHWLPSEDPNVHLQYGKRYLSKALDLFPDDALFVVSSNNIEFAKKEFPAKYRNVIFLENNPYHIEFHILSFCKHNIISNSTFGWWAAWLNSNASKMVVAPKQWLNPLCEISTEDLCPEDWIRVEAPWQRRL